VRGVVLRYRVMAYITGVVLVILCFVGIPLQLAGYPALANVVGTVHGILYIIYLVTAAMLAWRLRLRPGRTIVLLLAGTIPILTFVVERWMTRRYINPALAAETTADRERPLLHRAP
jgi:integral membrane protein